jgi:hypothetical protein
MLVVIAFIFGLAVCGFFAMLGALAIKAALDDAEEDYIPRLFFLGLGLLFLASGVLGIRWFIQMAL